MAARRAAQRRVRLAACKTCGALVNPESRVCPVCGFTQFSETWEGMIIIVRGDSVLAKNLSIEKPGSYAIKVAGRVVQR
ncbi:MAG: DNA-binding protein [Desulfurococcales archaeon]|nr:DNA-binding protein [Desulfurococcales archaeon]